ncbi:conserved hypothetical protein [Thiomonas arsenitoxydans]|uniref:Uncharacterized protein n=2 Tax=Thiomonas arsenitoxydans (strain DSM 22701 / CIP 110005 / 3As) TaxID=426114 RepID=A0ABM9T2U6_THIA3|nr:conserved hypothetical protein [Thiomonas arsenitoxydans]CQR34808.1 conserved hypothetical protein [Thiomonas arsenitoxydans]CQR36061.1 conserved hypothetical protein [Thiomonas arsenitoxydans]CQR36145.1 conserved hypothetical protein [Thiomonas arsenitoxydans]
MPHQARRQLARDGWVPQKAAAIVSSWLLDSQDLLDVAPRPEAARGSDGYTRAYLVIGRRRLVTFRTIPPMNEHHGLLLKGSFFIENYQNNNLISYYELYFRQISINLSLLQDTGQGYLSRGAIDFYKPREIVHGGA